MLVFGNELDIVFIVLWDKDLNVNGLFGRWCLEVLFYFRSRWVEKWVMEGKEVNIRGDGV